MNKFCECDKKQSKQKGWNKEIDSRMACLCRDDYSKEKLRIGREAGKVAAQKWVGRVVCAEEAQMLGPTIIPSEVRKSR